MSTTRSSAFEPHCSSGLTSPRPRTTWATHSVLRATRPAHWSTSASRSNSSPDRAEVRNNLGQTLLERGDAREALVHCQEAVRLRPDYPVARNNLGKVYRECKAGSMSAVIMLPRGDPAQSRPVRGVYGPRRARSRTWANSTKALASYRTALSLNPRDALALARIATILRDRSPRRPTAPAIESLLGRLRRCCPSGAGRSSSAWLQALDAVGEFDPRRRPDASRPMPACRADFRKWGRSYNPAAHHEFIGRLITAFTGSISS